MHGIETWPMKIEHELKMNCTEMSVIRCMCGVKLNERKKSEELTYKDDNDWVKRCITWEIAGIRQRRPKKTWWDCVKNDMESLGLSQKDAQSRNK